MSTPTRSQVVVRSIAALLLGITFVAVVFMGMRVNALYALQTTVAKRQVEHEALQQKYDDAVRRNELRIDQLEKILFGEIVAKMSDQTKPANTQQLIEQWQKNRDKELRDRITTLERRLYKLDK